MLAALFWVIWEESIEEIFSDKFRIFFEIGLFIWHLYGLQSLRNFRILLVSLLGTTGMQL